MMTVVFRGRRERRKTWDRWEDGTYARTWGYTPTPRATVRSWRPTLETGSAKPGRGGRRKRKVGRAKIRARIGAGVERKGWLLRWSRHTLMILRRPWRILTAAEVERIVQASPMILPVGCDVQFLEPKTLGRRERRRRARLRRRRVRVGWEGQRFRPWVRPWVLHQPSPVTAQLHEEIRRWAEEQVERLLIGSSAETPTPGA